jgi:hypothetical protein
MDAKGVRDAKGGAEPGSPLFINRRGVVARNAARRERAD